ncbi:MAG TPA: glycoside hydrolase family 2 TIM barrel-domain containing protein [Anaerolineaceae bacterium]|nr:glycoside hydrolase family 2 TIM barrel-domain containing protein [Anaerolineaceae bacterium]HPN52759.1 glycoside hydrolase family 2 TIM barrel-domain containing protein [Anaerolineaceae bacterium]
MPAAQSTLRTPWMPDPLCPLPEYPRPQLTRPAWINLNGPWDYAIQPLENPAPASYAGKILVPYAVESLLSGVQKPLMPDQKLWYRRVFADPRGELLGPANPDGRILLHFGAVDYECTIWVNGQRIGEHRGGYLPFTFDITAALHENENEIVLSVWDPSDAGMQQRGKQVLKPNGIWYTPISGIWQTVWLEGVPQVSIEALKLTPDLAQACLKVEVKLRGAAQAGLILEAAAFAGGEAAALGSAPAGTALTLTIPTPRPWSPADPFLYDLQVRLVRDGRTVDAVGSYFAMRSFGLAPDARGHLRFTLNGEPLFLYGPLDQGYFPDGLYTPPSEEAMLYDIAYTRRLGFNFIRKHIKVEPLRWYYHCDRLGMIVWQDMPNGGRFAGDVLAILAMLFGYHRNDTRWLSRFGRADEANRAEFRAELAGMVAHLYNSPCIAVWVPFNESWGQFNARETAEWLKQADPTRLVDHVSGWYDQGGPDFQSRHIYFKKLWRPRPDQRAFVMSEFGGFSLQTPGHMWQEDKKFGYRFYETPQALTAAYLALLEDEVLPLIPQGLTAAVYTQTTDVEIEINGFLTYDRKVEKMDAEAVRQAHLKLIAAAQAGGAARG